MNLLCKGYIAGVIYTKNKTNKAAFAIIYFCNHCNVRFDPIPVKVNHYVQVPWKYIKVCEYSDFFQKLEQKSHWPLDDLWPHICWSHMCDSTQESLCPSPMGIHQCMWIQWSILQNTTYILHNTYYNTVHTTYIRNIHTVYRMSDHIGPYSWKRNNFNPSLFQE